MLTSTYCSGCRCRQTAQAVLEPTQREKGDKYLNLPTTQIFGFVSAQNDGMTALSFIAAYWEQKWIGYGAVALL